MKSFATAFAMGFALWSLPAQAEAQATPAKYALVVGIDEYQESRIARLQYAVSDAEEMSRVLTDQGYKTLVLPNYRADRQTLIRELVKYAQIANEADTFLLYFAGHGVRNIDTGEVYWLAYDAVSGIPDVNGIRLRHLIDFVNDIPARQKIIMLDHCYSGEIAIDRTIAADRNELSTFEPSAPRNAIPDSAIAALAAATREGTFLVTASRGIARESATLDGHGVMTHVFLTAIKSTDADLAVPGGPVDGALSVGELKTYLYFKVKQVSRELGFEQVPLTKLYSPNESRMEQEWKPFFRQLGDGERSAFAARYGGLLLAWRSSNLINEDTRLLAENALREWVTPTAALSERHRRIVNALREFIDGGSQMSDDDVARAVGERIDAIAREGGPS